MSSFNSSFSCPPPPVLHTFSAENRLSYKATSPIVEFKTPGWLARDSPRLLMTNPILSEFHRPLPPPLAKQANAIIQLKTLHFTFQLFAKDLIECLFRERSPLRLSTSKVLIKFFSGPVRRPFFASAFNCHDPEEKGL